MRPAAPGDDLAAAGRIVQQAYFGVAGYPHDAEFDEELANVAGRPASTTAVLGFIDGRVAGCLTFVADPHAEIYEFPIHDATTFRYFGIRPEARGSGLAEAMVRWCVEETRRLALERIRIHTLTVMTAAQRFYERLGFVRTPEYDEQWEDARGLAYVLDVRGD